MTARRCRHAFALQRWLKRDQAATIFAPSVAALEAPDDRTLVGRFKPFPTFHRSCQRPSRSQ
jgi:hypothetical protein